MTQPSMDVNNGTMEPKPKTKRTLVGCLLETLTCPVCLETLKQETLLCGNGHAICRDCQGKQVCCPTCSDAFVAIKKNTVISQVIEVIRNACDFEGCGYMKEGHEVECGFRAVACKFPECEWKGRRYEWVGHFKIEHLQSMMAEFADKWMDRL